MPAVGIKRGSKDRTIRFIKGDGPFVRRGGLNEERTRLFFVSAAPTHADRKISVVLDYTST